MNISPLIVRQLPPNFRLFKGGHQAPPVDGTPTELCFTETIAWIAGEPHSDAPQCMCRILASYGMELNDRYDDEERQLLKPLLYRCVGTRSTREVERKRCLVFVDAAVREIVPMTLDALKYNDLATRLRDLAPIVDVVTAGSASRVAADVRDEVRKRRGNASYTTYAATAANYAANATAATYAATTATATAAAAAAVDVAYADAADETPEERRCLRSAARRPIVLASIAAFERAIAVTE